MMGNLMGVALTTLFLISGAQSSPEDYFTSPAAIQKLIKVEQQVLAAFSEYASLLERRVEKVRGYLEDYEKSVLTGIRISSQVSSTKIKVFKNEKDLKELSDQVAAHPLMTYRLIRRFVIHFQDLERDLGNQNEKKVLNVIEKIRKGIRLPQARDVEGTIEGLLRVQDAYDLNITEFTRGIFQGLETNSALTAMDCYQVGLYASEAQIYTRSIEWLQRAYRLTTQENDQTISTDEIIKDLGRVVSEHDETHRREPENMYVYRQTIGSVQNLLTPDNEFRLEKGVKNRKYILYKEQENIMDLHNFAVLCSGKTLQSPSTTKGLYCLYKSNPRIRFLTERVEFLHFEPDVYQVYDVLGESAMKRIIQLATPQMTRAKVVGMTADEQYSTARTSTSSWIKEGSDQVLQGIPYRIQTITGLDTLSPGSTEDLQVASYGIGGHFNPHSDLIFEDLVPGYEERKMGDRIATFLFYVRVDSLFFPASNYPFLSDVARGGGTAFPRLGIVAQPVKGSAIFWFNLRSDGQPDPLSLHGGCPVLYGTKHVANKWIRANAQFGTRKCGLLKMKKRIMK